MADEHPPRDPPRSPFAPDAADGAVPTPACAPAEVSASTPNGGRLNGRTKALLLAALVIVVSIAAAFGGRVIADLPKYPLSANSNVRQPWISSRVASTWSPEGNQTDELKTWTNESDCLANAESGWLRIIREEPRLPETGVQADTGIDTPRNDAEATEVLITEYLGLVTNFSQTVTEMGMP